MLVIVVAYRVFYDGGITESELVVFLDELLLGLPVTLVGELLGFEEVGELTSLVDFTEAPLPNIEPLIFLLDSFSLPTNLISWTFILSFLSIFTSRIT